MPDDEHSANAESTNVAQALAFFTRQEAQTIEAAMGGILPADELGPGAVEAGGLCYLDRALSGAEMSLQGPYRLGLRQLF
jgi:gluconate 2-dehydrogenase gamma chain